MTTLVAFYNTYEEVCHLMRVINNNGDGINNVQFARVLRPYIDNEKFPCAKQYVCIFYLNDSQYEFQCRCIFNLNNIILVNNENITKSRIQGKSKWIPAVTNNENIIDIEKTLPKIQFLITYH